ncbi:hypothetical protein DZA35_00725 [Arcobacter sp. HD9-500m-PIT-SAG03]|nr:hypothetical protein DZA35_00725 [Arcobacter sp. HD9-500m-PIT-SAG03]
MQEIVTNTAGTAVAILFVYVLYYEYKKRKSRKTIMDQIRLLLQDMVASHQIFSITVTVEECEN